MIARSPAIDRHLPDPEEERPFESVHARVVDFANLFFRLEQIEQTKSGFVAQRLLQGRCHTVRSHGICNSFPTSDDDDAIVIWLCQRG
jgi:hypothetical protein